MKRWSWWLSFLVILLVNFFLISTLTPGPSQRTEVSYTFFRQQVLAGNVAEISAESTRAPGMRSSIARPVVLIIIHDLWTRQLIERTLSSHAYTVLTASNGATGLRLVHLEHPDVVMLPHQPPVRQCPEVKLLPGSWPSLSLDVTVRPGDPAELPTAPA